MKLVIVTGLSGAGKSRAIDALEDIGFYCIDNMPPQLIPNVVEIFNHSSRELKKLAVVSDTRGGEMFNELSASLEILKQRGIKYKVLFLDASTNELFRRYKETRRRHPLAESSDATIPELVTKEKEMLRPLRGCADYVIDTTHLSTAQLKDRIMGIFLENKYAAMQICCMSFGFKHGVPTEADLVFDVRCFPNPFYQKELRELTGLDKSIQDFVLNCEEIHEFESHLFKMIDFLIPQYIKEGKSQLVIAIGCTGGHHRSVVLTERLAAHLKGENMRVLVNHRDITK